VPYWSGSSLSWVNRRHRSPDLCVAGRRRILFVKCKPVASDSPDPLTFMRQRDVTAVKLGAAERYEIPDALEAGG
jgi:hypothetical protein